MSDSDKMAVVATVLFIALIAIFIMLFINLIKGVRRKMSDIKKDAAKPAGLIGALKWVAVLIALALIMNNIHITIVHKTEREEPFTVIHGGAYGQDIRIDQDVRITQR